VTAIACQAWAPPHDDKLSQFHRQWRLIVQQLCNDDAAAMSVDDACFAFLTKKICRIEAGEYDRNLER
jgi:hypothetical protein